MMGKSNIGLFGFGTVGQGLYYTLQNSAGYRADIKKIVVKDRQKDRKIPIDQFSFDKEEILEDEDISIVVELIDDAKEAFSIVSSALKSRKHVVTANKKMLALNLKELIELAKFNQKSLLYEAAACGSIPIIRCLEEYFDNEELLSIKGIFNGTTNFILTRIIQEGLDYPSALKKAQILGFAERDPTNDVEGFDALYKLVLIAFHGFGIILQPTELCCYGIATLGDMDIRFAKEKDLYLKLVAQVFVHGKNKIAAFVLPTLVPKSNSLSKIENEFNGVLLEGKFSGKQFFEGRGAGSIPTGAAVLSDVSAISYDYCYENKKFNHGYGLILDQELTIRIYYRFIDHIDKEDLLFDKIETTHTTQSYGYIIGNIKLYNIIKGLQNIRNKGNFIAHILDQ